LSFEAVPSFSHKEALGLSGTIRQNDDTAIGLSTSGKSENVLAGLKEAKRQGLNTFLISGNSSSINEDCDLHLRIPSSNTAQIQETTIFLGHIIAEQVELNLNA
jgi:D-sedoheptulose 7-phosphate isomerase